MAKLTYEQKCVLAGFGYVAGTVVLCAALYKWFAMMIGKEVAKALVTAGVVVLA